MVDGRIYLERPSQLGPVESVQWYPPEGDGPWRHIAFCAIFCFGVPFIIYAAFWFIIWNEKVARRELYSRRFGGGSDS